MIKFSLFFMLVSLVLGCGESNSRNTSIPKDWEMIEVYGDEVAVLNEGGYYGLFYD